MITVNTVLDFNGEKIVPIRAIPFVTGDDMSPKCLAGILADPDSWFLAFVLSPSNGLAKMLPKNWQQYRDQLAVIAGSANNLDLANRTTLEILPASTFVYWEALWHTHENYFLPDRGEIAQLPHEEQVNYELQPNANIPKALIDLVFEGFQVPSLSKALTAITSTTNSPPSLLPPVHQSSSAQTQIRADTSTGGPALVHRGFIYKKCVLLGKLRPIWDSIDGDFQHAKENGLSTAAKATKHGEWYEESAKRWALKNGKLKDSTQVGAINSVFDLPGKMHTIKG